MKALEGYRVLDLTHILAGPFATYQLGTLGADVIRIESPGGPDLVRGMGDIEALNARSHGLLYQAQASNKRSLSLDLKTLAGRAVFSELVKTADVVVENFRTGALDQLGLNYEALEALRPHLIYCSITGFGRTGPKATHTAYDNVIQAYCGLMRLTGTPESAPTRVGAPVLDYGTGAQAAFAITAALLRRERTGKGQRLDISMLDAAILLMTSAAFSTEATGQRPAATGNSHPTVFAYGCYDTADGLLMLGAHSARQIERLWETLGRTDLAAAVRGCSHTQIEALYDEHHAVLKETLKAANAAHWEGVLAPAGVPAARLRHLDEALADPQLNGRAVLQPTAEAPGGVAGARVPVSATTWSQDGPEIRSAPPYAGEHNEDILRELGYSSEAVKRLADQGIT